jgi:hypothetical protein
MKQSLQYSIKDLKIAFKSKMGVSNLVFEKGHQISNNMNMIINYLDLDKIMFVSNNRENYIMTDANNSHIITSNRGSKGEVEMEKTVQIAFDVVAREGTKFPDFLIGIKEIQKFLN